MESNHRDGPTGHKKQLYDTYRLNIITNYCYSFSTLTLILL